MESKVKARIRRYAGDGSGHVEIQRGKYKH